MKRIEVDNVLVDGVTLVCKGQWNDDYKEDGIYFIPATGCTIHNVVYKGEIISQFYTPFYNLGGECVTDVSNNSIRKDIVINVSEVDDQILFTKEIYK